MAEAWLIEVAKGMGKLFLNPLIYWALLIILLGGIIRIKQERLNFGSKVFDLFSEWKHTWTVSLFSGLILSILFLVGGMVLSYETILLVAIVTVLLSITFRFTLLSPSYTIGIPFLLLLFLPTIMERQTIFDENLFADTNYTALALLAGLLMIVESILIGTVKRNETFPEITRSSRGYWVGQHRIKKLSIVPFFVLVPAGLITPFASWWPYFSIGEENYSLVLFPFLIGFDYIAKGHFTLHARKKLSKFNALLAIGVILIAVGGLIGLPFSIAAIIAAIIGKEYLNYKYRVGDRLRRPFYGPLDQGLKIVGIIPLTPAAKMDVFVGEIILKVNGNKVSTEVEFYEALQKSGAFFKLEILDDQNEVRFVQGPLYEGDHYELGFLFAAEPYRQKRQKYA